MSMGIVSDSEFTSEIGKLNPSLSQNKNGEAIAIIKDIEKGRPIGGLQVPEGLRKIIGEESVTNGRGSALELADQFGIKPSSVSAYSQGAHSTASYSDRPDLTHINEAKLRVSKRARVKLILALNSLTKEKIQDAKAKDIAGVAKDMSAVIRNMEPETTKNNNGAVGPTFIFYSPQFRKEEHFDVVRVQE